VHAQDFMKIVYSKEQQLCELKGWVVLVKEALISKHLSLSII
jgi:hypothetical protein